MVICDHVFQVGDMVWAKMKSQPEPWWPGHVYSEELATPMVRCSKREEGLLLVSLFGASASSFCWFHPSHLIPFDSNYAQNSLRTSPKALHHALLHLNTRIALAFSCICQRPINLPFPHSADAIRKARVSFRPNSVTQFLRRLALEAAAATTDDVEFIKNKAMLLSYRKAVFEGSPNPKNKAPLSRMVVKNAAKLKEHAKKDDYIFKRRDEKDIEKVASSFLPVSFKDSTSEFALKDATCIDQAKVKSAVNVQEVEGEKVISHPKGKTDTSDNKKKQKEDEISLAEMFLTKKRSQREGPQRSAGNDEKDLSLVLSDLHALAVDPCNTINRGSCIKGKKAFLKFRSLVFKKSKDFSLSLANGELNANKFSQVPPVKPPSELKQGPPDHQEEPTMLILKFPQGGSLPSFNQLKARFMRYGPMDHSATQILRKTFSCEMVFKHKAHAQAACRFVAESPSLFGNTSVKCTLKDVGDMDATKTEPPIEVQKDHHQSAMEVRPPSILKASGGEEAAGKGSREGDFIRALHDSHLFGVEPSNKVNGRSHVKGRKAKGQNFSLPLAVGETNASKDSVEPPPAKSPSGPKRSLLNLQEEIHAAKRKKAGDLISSIKEKKMTKMNDQAPARDVKQPVATTLKKPGPGPTMLMLKFPQGGSLPSYNELKARFTRYGPMDHSATHIFWNTFSCQVLFRHGAHAEAARRFVVESSSVFGNTGVKCSLKEVEVPTEQHQADVDRSLKSILKKSGGEESEMKNKSGATSCSHLTADGSSSSSKKKFEKGVVRGPSPCVQMTPLPLMTPNIDIEKQMLSLLTRCNDVVTNVSSMLGYMPYHPL